MTGPLVWAALDCPGGWSAGIAGRPMVLGTMTARMLGACRRWASRTSCMAWQRGSEGRKHHSATGAVLRVGELLARAEATWITVDPTTSDRKAAMTCQLPRSPA